MNLKIKTTTQKIRIKQFYDLIIENNVCLSFGGIRCTGYKDILTVSIAFDNEDPVACCLTYEENSIFRMYNIAAYTKDKYRKLGIQNKLVPITISKTKKIKPDINFVNSDPNFYNRYFK